MEEVGFVEKSRNFLLYLNGLPSARINDLVENEEGTRGVVSALLKDSVEVLLLDEGSILPGQMFKTSKRKLTLPAGKFLLGRAVNPLGIPIDGKPPLDKNKSAETINLIPSARGIAKRHFIDRQFDTGLTLIDSFIPIGKGQRELILGDARSGKTDFLTDIIINQKQTGVICIYTAIGKPLAEVRSIIDTLRYNKALFYTIIMATSSSDPAPLIFLTPKSAFDIAEYFQSNGQDVLVVLDDMGNHAKIYREISLLGDRSPGKESYPGDIFYQHSYLLERAGNFKNGKGVSSITALPVMELNLNDFTTFIPTNLMSMTDGHFLFKSSLYNQGQRPAIDYSLSVSRVGQQTQNRVLNTLVTKVKQVLAQAAQLESVSRFAFELPYATQLILKQKGIFEEIFKQQPLTYIPKEIQTILLALPFTSFFYDKDLMFVRRYKDIITEALQNDKEMASFCQSASSFKDANELIHTLENGFVMKRLDQVISGAPINKTGMKTQVKNTR